MLNRLEDNKQKYIEFIMMDLSPNYQIVGQRLGNYIFLKILYSPPQRQCVKQLKYNSI